MRLELAADGGFAALPGLRRPLSIDTDALPPEVADELRQLVESTRFFSLPESVKAPAGAADYREYTITANDGDRSHTVRVPELSASPELLRLIERLQSLR